MRRKGLSLAIVVFMLACLTMTAFAVNPVTLDEVLDDIQGFYYYSEAATGQPERVSYPKERPSETCFINFYEMTIEADGSFTVEVYTGDGREFKVDGVFHDYFKGDSALWYQSDEGVTVSVSIGNLFYEEGLISVDIKYPLDDVELLEINGLKTRHMDCNPLQNNAYGISGTYEISKNSPELGINHVYEKNEGVILTVDGPFFTLSFEDGGKEYDLNGYFTYIDDNKWSNFHALGVFESYHGYPNFANFTQGGYGDDDEGYYFYFGWDNGTDLFWWEVGYLDKIEEPAEPQDYDVNIMGYGHSITEEYMVNILGNIQGIFSEGVNVLDFTDVQAQNLSINTFNLTNGMNRVMGISTVEKITVTVTGGEITNVQITGRAQTTPGNFDRYTVNCNTF